MDRRRGLEVGVGVRLEGMGDSAMRDNWNLGTSLKELKPRAMETTRNQ